MSIWTHADGPGHTRKTVALVALCGALPLLSLGYQIAAKTTANTLAAVSFGPAWFGLLLRQPSLAALLVLEIASFAAWMTALSEMKLSAAFPMSAITYVFVIVAGWTLFHEPASLAQVLGGAAILGGIWLIGQSDSEPSSEPRAGTRERP